MQITQPFLYDTAWEQEACVVNRNSWLFNRLRANKTDISTDDAKKFLDFVNISVSIGYEIADLCSWRTQ